MLCDNVAVSEIKKPVFWSAHVWYIRSATMKGFSRHNNSMITLQKLPDDAFKTFADKKARALRQHAACTADIEAPSLRPAMEA